jgi:hypothetical protein
MVYLMNLYFIVVAIAIFKFSIPRLNITNNTEIELKDIYTFEM